MKIKNVIVINDFDYAQGGASTVAIDTANALVNKGFNVIFFSAVHSENSTLDKKIINCCLQAQESLNYKNIIKGALSGIHNKECEKKLNKLLDEYSSDDTIVHVHGWTKACSSIIFRVLKKRRYKTFLTLHDYFSICPNGALLNYKTKKCCEVKCCSYKCLKTNCDSRNMAFKIYRFIRQKRYNKDMDFCDINCIFVSQLQKKIISANKEIKKIFKVISSPIVELDKDYVSQKKYDYVYIGRDSEEKGISLYVELAKKIPQKTFLIVGDYKGEHIKNLIITGWVSELEVEHYLKQSRCLIVPSLLPEPFGLVVVKAVAFGVVCVVSDNIGACEYINDKTGIVFKQGNIDDLVQKLELIKGLTPVENRDVLISPDEYIDKLVKYYYEVV